MSPPADNRGRSASPAEREPAGWLPILGMAIGTWLAALLVQSLLVTFASRDVHIFRVGDAMSTVRRPHMVGFGIARLWGSTHG
jgi:hypothetical protein